MKINLEEHKVFSEVLNTWVVPLSIAKKAVSEAIPEEAVQAIYRVLEDMRKDTQDLVNKLEDHE